MKKKIVALFAVAALAVSMFSTTAMAAEENDFAGAADGKYELDASLSAIIKMGSANVEFGGILESAELNVANGEASVTLGFKEAHTTTMMMFGSSMEMTVNAYGNGAEVSGKNGTTTTTELAYKDGTEWKTAEETLYASGYLKTMTFPVTEATDTYEIGVNIGGSQFGGNNPYAYTDTTLGELHATLTVNWAEDELVSGTYCFDASEHMMFALLKPVVNIDVENMTFDLYKNVESEQNINKGSGTITFNVATGAYTMTYTDTDHAGRTTTFVYDEANNAIKFTSVLAFGSASFNITDDAGNFVEYVATITDLSDDTTTDDTTTDDTTTDGTTDKDVATDDAEEEDAEEDATTSPSTGDATSYTWMIIVCLAAVAVIGTAARRRHAA